MAKVFWAGCAPKVAMVINYTIVYGSGTTYTAQLGSAIVSQVAITDADTTAAALLAKINAAGFPQFSEITWTVQSAIITAAANTAGIPFTLDCVTASGGTGSVGVTTVTSCSSPNDISIAANWSTGAFPASSDTIEFPADSPDVLYGLTYFFDNAINISIVNLPAAFEQSIGLPSWNSNGYLEYRPTCLKLVDAPTSAAVVVNVGYGPGNGSSLINIDMTTANKITALVTTTGSAATGELGAFHIENCVTGSSLSIFGGSVSLGDGVTIGVTIGNNAELTSFGATITSFTASGKSESTIPAVSNMPISMVEGSTLTTIGSGTLTGDISLSSSSSPGPTLVMNNSGGYNGSSFSLGPYATLDLTQDDVAKSFNGTTISLSSGTSQGSKPAVASFLNGNGVGSDYVLQPVGCALEQCNVEFGAGVGVTVS